MRDDTRFKDIEKSFRTSITPGQFAVLRLDGKGFSKYTRGLEAPFDLQFMGDMDAAAVALMGHIPGIRLAFVQSDEISIVLSDRDQGGDIQQFMFDGQVQKLVSVSASMATAEFNALRYRQTSTALAHFDSRAFELPDDETVIDYLLWRQLDGLRNSLSMTASAHFSHKQLLGVGSAGKREMLAGIGVDHDRDTPWGFRYGRLIARVPKADSTTFDHGRTGKPETVDFVRHAPEVIPAPHFGDEDVAQTVRELLAGSRDASALIR